MFWSIIQQTNFINYWTVFCWIKNEVAKFVQLFFEKLLSFLKWQKSSMRRNGQPIPNSFHLFLASQNRIFMPWNISLWINSPVQWIQFPDIQNSPSGPLRGLMSGKVPDFESSGFECRVLSSRKLLWYRIATCRNAVCEKMHTKMHTTMHLQIPKEERNFSTSLNFLLEY